MAQFSTSALILYKKCIAFFNKKIDRCRGYFTKSIMQLYSIKYCIVPQAAMANFYSLCIDMQDLPRRFGLSLWGAMLERLMRYPGMLGVSSQPFF